MEITYTTADAIKALEVEPHLQFTAIRENNGWVDFWRLRMWQGWRIRASRNSLPMDYIPANMNWEAENDFSGIENHLSKR